jgi:hypothetical protein
MAKQSLEYYLRKYNSQNTEVAKSVIKHFQGQKLELSIKADKTPAEQRRLQDLKELSKLLN